MKLKQQSVFFMIWALVLALTVPAEVFAQDAGESPLLNRRNWTRCWRRLRSTPIHYSPRY